MAGILASGCFSSNHVGRDPRKVYMTMKDGKRGYTKGGEFHTEMGFGGALVDIVGDNPDAQQAARTFRSRAVGGFLMTIAGTLCIPTVLSYDLARELDNRDVPDSHGYVLLGCGVLAIAGVTYLISALPYQYDAVNIYNDTVDTRGVQWPPPPAPQLPSMPQGAYQGPPGN